MVKHAAAATTLVYLHRAGTAGFIVASTVPHGPPLILSRLTPNPGSSRGDGIAIGARAGAVVALIVVETLCRVIAPDHHHRR